MRFILGVLALFVTTPVVAQLSDTMQRAAYCIGVLQFTLNNSVSGLDVPDNVCLRWKEQRYSSREVCIGDLEQASRTSLEQKLRRYSDYLHFEMGQRVILQRADAMRMMMSGELIQEKGRADARAIKMGATPTSTSLQIRCANRCRGHANHCLVDCYAERERNRRGHHAVRNATG